MPELTTAEALLRLLIAAGLGGAIGLERELRDHEAGFRTHLLVSLGACVFTLVSAYAWTDWTFSQRSGIVFDPTRIAAQIVTGVGFLGAGAIIVRGISVRGLTTAATLWAVAAIGMAAGTGYYAVGVGAAVLVLISLGPLKLISTRLVSRVRPEEAELAIQLVPEGEASRVLDARSRSTAARSARSSSATSARSTSRCAPRAGRSRRVWRRRSTSSTTSSACNGGREGAGSRRGTGTSWTSCGPRCRAGSSSCSRPTATTRPRTGRPTTRTRVRRPRSGGMSAAPDEWVLGEDSGIEVAALGGRPGIASARWAADGVAQLLVELDGVDDRRARYVCELVALGPAGEERRGTGILEGTIATERRGDEGFGYDPIFVPAR